MLSREQNDLITLTGPGTPGGDMMRRYWHPVALSEELKDDEPVPVTVLSEELVLFRSADGKPQLIGRYCPHRSVDLSYGRVEAGGLRCIYHGWVMDGRGRCTQQPGEPPGSTFKDKIRTPAYPCHEVNGVILAYLGPLDSKGEPPRVPAFDFVKGKPSQVFAMKMHQACNYLQANEGNIDPQHLSFLHVVPAAGSQLIPDMNNLVAADAAPSIEPEEKPWGQRIETTRMVGPDTKYVRTTNFVMPNAAAFDGLPPFAYPGEPFRMNMGYQMHFHVPIDDRQHWKYTIIFRYEGELDHSFLRKAFFPDIDANYYSPRNRTNRFLQSRDEIRSGETYAGMGSNFYDHDTLAVETQGVIMDRSNEHLGTTDRPVILMRRQLLKAVEDVRHGKDPLFVQRAGDPDEAKDLYVRIETMPTKRVKQLEPAE